MNTTHVSNLWSRILIVAGGMAMLVGAVDPMEGSLIILPGSAVVALGAFLSQREKGFAKYWFLILALIALGVGAMFGLTAWGGVGGNSGHSMWWELLCLPYPIGWVLGMANLVCLAGRNIRRLCSSRSAHAIGK
jgi:hypothetical protein